MQSLLQCFPLAKPYGGINYMKRSLLAAALGRDVDMSCPRFLTRSLQHGLVGVVALVAAVSAAAAPVILSNPTTSVAVNGGEANNGLVPFGGFFDYTDLIAGATPTWSIDPFLRFSGGSTAVLSNGLGDQTAILDWKIRQALQNTSFLVVGNIHRMDRKELIVDPLFKYGAGLSYPKK